MTFTTVGSLVIEVVLVPTFEGVCVLGNGMAAWQSWA